MAKFCHLKVLLYASPASFAPLVQVLLEKEDSGVSLLGLLRGHGRHLMRTWIRLLAEGLQSLPLNVSEAEG